MSVGTQSNLPFPPVIVNGIEQNHRPSRYGARAYGLDIRSDIALPEFSPAGNGADVEVILERAEEGFECTSPQWDFRKSEVICRFPKVARFQVRGGREIRVTPVRGADSSLIRLYVEGMMMAILLHQRGYYVLHASVVEMAGRGVGFLGHIGAGKSTMALALERRGARLIADDNAAIDLNSAQVVVLPAFPRVKVYPAIAQALGIADECLLPLHASQVKKTRQVESNFLERSVRLDRMYVLSRLAQNTIERLGRGESLIELITNSVPTRWGLPGGKEQMKNSAVLARHLPVYRVRTFSRLEEIEPLARDIETHATAETQPALDQVLVRSCGASGNGE